MSGGGTFRFARTVGGYAVVAIALALIVHFVLVRSPRTSWIFPPAGAPAGKSSP